MSVPFSIHGGSYSGSNCAIGTIWGFYFKVASAPEATTTLIDYDGGVMYCRTILTSGMHVILEFAAGTSGARTLDLTGSLTLTTGEWYWTWGLLGTGAAFPGSENNSGIVGIAGQVYGTGGTTGGRQDLDGITGIPGYGTVNCALGIGASLSSGYANFPNSAGNEMSKFYQARWGCAGNFSGHGPATPPSADNGFYDSGFFGSGYPTGGTGALDFEYNARQLLGGTSTLTDDTGNYDASGTFTINSDGPFT